MTKKATQCPVCKRGKREPDEFCSETCATRHRDLNGLCPCGEIATHCTIDGFDLKLKLVCGEYPMCVIRTCKTGGVATAMLPQSGS